MVKATKGKGKAVASASHEEAEATLDPIYDGRKALSKEENAVFKELSKRTMLSTRFLYAPDLACLGLDGMTTMVMEKAGLRRLSHCKAPTHPQWAMEFLSSLEMVEAKGKEAKHIKFCLNHKRHKMTFEKLSHVLGIDKKWDGTNKMKPRLACIPIWSDLTRLPAFQTQSKSSMITHPVVRLLCRFFSMVFLGQGEPTKVSKEVLSLLYAVLNDDGGVPNWASLFISSCLDIKKAKKGKIALGGMITLIGYGLGFKSTVGVEHVSSHFSYDMAALMQLDA